MASVALPPPSAGSVQGAPSPGAPAMQQIGAAQGAGQGQPQNQQLGKDAALQALTGSIQKLAESTMEVARLASSTYPQIVGYVSKIAEIGQAMQTEVQSLVQQAQAQAGAQQPQPSAMAPTPTEGSPAV